MSSKKRPKILVVDDERELVDTIADLLSGEGLTIECATSGAKFIEKVQQGAPDVILIDQMMPGMSGTEALTALHDMLGRSDIPVILMSASKEPKLESQTWNEFLPKPFDLDVLVEKVTKYIKVVVK